MAGPGPSVSAWHSTRSPSQPSSDSTPDSEHEDSIGCKWIEKDRVGGTGARTHVFETLCVYLDSLGIDKTYSSSSGFSRLTGKHLVVLELIWTHLLGLNRTRSNSHGRIGNPSDSLNHICHSLGEGSGRLGEKRHCETAWARLSRWGHTVQYRATQYNTVQENTKPNRTSGCVYVYIICMCIYIYIYICTYIRKVN